VSALRGLTALIRNEPRAHAVLREVILRRSCPEGEEEGLEAEKGTSRLAHLIDDKVRLI
jgi:hypothetical protein